MNIEDFERSKIELAKEKEQNNKQIIINDERYRMTNFNRFENKFMVTLVISLMTYMLLTISSAILVKFLGVSAITNILPSLSYPIVMLGGSLVMGTVGKILFDKKYKIKENFKAFSNAKNESEKLEEEVQYQIELEKAKNRNKVISEAIEVLSSNKKILNRISNRYELGDKTEHQTIEEAEKKVEELSTMIEEQYKELDVYTTQKVLHNRFWKVRKKFERRLNLMHFSATCGMFTIMLASLPLILISPEITLPASLVWQLGLFVTGIVGGSVYTLKTNKDYKNLFNKLNSQLGEYALEENLDKTFEMSLEEKEKIESMIKNKIKDVSLAQVQLQENKRYLDTFTTEEENKEDVLFKDFPQLHITEETKKDVLEHPERYANCDVRIRNGQFYTDEEFERYIEESLNRPLPGEENGPKLVKKINPNIKNN